MKLRALLFVPADRPDRMRKALASGADALILDLEDSVLPQAKAAARRAVAAFMAEPRTLPLFVRVNPAEALMLQDLEAVVPHAPDGIVLPKAEGGPSVAALDRHLTRLGNSAAKILPIATETPTAIFALGTYGGITERLCGLTWGAEDLPANIGAATSRKPNGEFTAPFELVRSLTLFGAHAAGVTAIETVYPAIKDTDGLAIYAARGRRDGFSGMMALHPAQVPIIATAFTPSQCEIAWARNVIEAFALNPAVGAIQLDGKMLDAPHLRRARTILTQAEL